MSLKSHDREIDLGRLLWRTPYAQYYGVVGKNDWYAKVAAATRKKRYRLGVTVRFPTRLYTSCKFGVWDVIRHEYNMLQRLQEEIPEYLPLNASLLPTRRGELALTAQRPRNFDGSLARPICAMGPVANACFWSQIDRIVTTLRTRQLCLLGVFSAGTPNVLVHKRAEKDWIPVITDVLKLSRRLYYYQFWHSGQAAWHKFDRNLARFHTKFDLRT